MKILVVLLFTFFSTASVAGNLINNAVIKEIASSNDGYTDNFYLRFESGDGVCATGGSYVVFPKKKPYVKSGDTKTEHTDLEFNRMFSLALAAYTLGKPVRVYSFGSDDCKQATMIELK